MKYANLQFEKLYHPDDRRHVLAVFVHRMTTETRARYPQVTARMLAGGYRMPERSDAEWLRATYFRVRADGRLDRRCRYCRTTYGDRHAAA